MNYDLMTRAVVRVNESQEIKRIVFRSEDDFRKRTLVCPLMLRGSLQGHPCPLILAIHGSQSPQNINGQTKSLLRHFLSLWGKSRTKATAKSRE